MATSRRPVTLTAAVATAVALGATAALASTPAAAAGTPLEGYELTWGIKQSYRTYVTGMAAGSFSTADGAAQAPDNGAFTFTGGTGSYDPADHTVALGFEGSVTAASTAHGFEITLSDVKFDSGAARITADVTRNGGTTDDVPLAEVTVNRAMTDMPTTLTEEAADALGSPGYEGAAGDPLTVTETDGGTESPSPTPTPTPSTPAGPEPSASADPTTSPSTGTSAPPSGDPTASASSPGLDGAADQGDIADGNLGWGVKESFRRYVVDGVAKGGISIAGGASQAAGNGASTFPDGTGTYDLDAATLDAAFAGSVTFRGHEEGGEYGLDLTLSGLRVELDGGAGALTADVESLGETSEDVVLADLDAGSPELTADGDVISLDDIAATLTDEGADAFGGFYAAGAELDPVDLDVALTDSAELPDGDGGSGDTAGTSGGAGGTGTTGGTGTGGVTGGTGGLAATGSDLPAGPLTAASALIVAAGAAVVTAARRRRPAGAADQV